MVLFPPTLCRHSTRSFRYILHPSWVSGGEARRRVLLSHGPRYKEHSEELESMKKSSQWYYEIMIRRVRGRLFKVEWSVIHWIAKTESPEGESPPHGTVGACHRHREAKCRKRNVYKKWWKNVLPWWVQLLNGRTRSGKEVRNRRYNGPQGKEEHASEIFFSF